MASEGVLYVEILPATRGIGKEITGDLDKAFKQSEKTGKSMLGRLGGMAKALALTLTGALAVVTGLALKGGISRALNIEDATAKLKGLGHDTQVVDQIMTDALASVKGTAFGLDAAATSAASAVAAGIKPGQELEHYLRLTADAATIAGVSLEEMGDLMNKVAAKGKVSAREINQFTERGIPILQMLADEYGVTAEEMSKMVSRGEVDAERFRKALEDNVGGAALESGNTTRGAFANMMAALSRLGLVFAEGPLSKAKDFFNEMITLIDGFAERAKAVFGGIEFEGNPFEGLAESILSFVDGIDWGFFKDLAGMFSPIGAAIKVIQPLLPPLLEAFTDLARTLQDSMGDLILAIADALGQMGASLVPLIPIIVDVVNILMEGLAPVFDAIADVLPAIGGMFAKLVPILIPLIEILVDLLEVLLPILPPLVELLEVIIPPLTVVLELLAQILGWVADVISSTVVPVIEWLVLSLGQLIEFVTYVFVQGWKDAWDWVANLFGDFADAVNNIIGDVLQWFKELPGKILGFFAGAGQWLWDSGVNIVTGLWDGLVNLWEKVSGWFGDLPGMILDFFAGAGRWLYDIGKAIVNGLWEGMKWVWDSVAGWWDDVWTATVDGWNDFWGIQSPSKLMKEMGAHIMGGLEIGLEDNLPNLEGTMEHVYDSFDDDPDLGGSSGNIYIQAAPGRTTFQELEDYRNRG